MIDFNKALLLIKENPGSFNYDYVAELNNAGVLFQM